MIRKLKQRAAALVARGADDVAAGPFRDLEQGRFREAIAGFKALLKSAPTPDPAARQGLADAYAGRARQLAAKGMPKEALVMWENRAALGLPPAIPEHPLLLLRLGRVEAALAFLKGEAGADPGFANLLRGHLAARYLAGAVPAKLLDPEDPILTQGGAASAALDAWCAGDDAAVAAALAGIPFRSPYRDLATLLKGLTRLETDPESIAGQLDRIADDSPFASLRDAVRLALLPEQALLDRLPTLGPAVRAVVLPLRGWPPERATLWQGLRALQKNPARPAAPADLLEFICRHRRVLGESWTNARLPRLVVAIGNPGKTIPLFRRVAGRALTNEESELIGAWDYEQDRPTNTWAVQIAWTDYARTLQSRMPGGPQPGTDEALRIAFCLRRADRHLNLLGPDDGDRAPEALLTIVVEALHESLTLDPDDRATYLRLIDWSLRQRDLKEARRILALAQARWPRDRLVLTAALDIAIASAAFKKAATVAREILAVDPINAGVRERLVEAHLAHARKNLLARRADLAVRALDQAREWVRGGQVRERLDLLDGLVALQTDPPAGRTRLRALLAGLGDGLDARLALLLESSAVGLPTDSLVRQLELPPLGAPASAPARRGRKAAADRIQPPAIPDLLAFFTRLRNHLDRGERLPAHVAMHLSAPLEAAARLRRLERSEFEASCETLRRAGSPSLRLSFAQGALQYWKDDPLFEFHAFEARFGESRHWQIPPSDLRRLEGMLDRVAASGDERLVHRVGEMLGRIKGGGGLSPRFLGDIFDDDDEDDDFFGGFDDDDDDDDDFGPGPVPPREMLIGLVQEIGPDGLRALFSARGPLAELRPRIEGVLGKGGVERMIESVIAEAAREGIRPRSRGRGRKRK